MNTSTTLLSRPFRDDLMLCSSDALSTTAASIDLDGRLATVGDALARDIVSGRRIPIGKMPFVLAQCLQAVPGALEACGNDERAILSGVTAFCRRLYARPSDRYDRDFSPAAVEDVWNEVISAWGKVRVKGGNALNAAFLQAASAPVTVLPPVDIYGLKFLRLLSTAYHLQEFQGSATIYLPVRALGPLLGVAWSTVSSLLNHAVRHALLELVDGNYSQKERKAKEYRFNHASRLYQRPLATAPRPSDQ